MRTETIEYNGVKLRVTGDHCEAYAATWTDPGGDESFEVYKITDAGIDVTHLHEDDMDEIEKLVLQGITDDDEYARDAYYEGLREEQLLGARA